MKSNNKTLSHSHAGHRSRLRAKFRKAGIDNWLPHEVLEFLLSFVVARKDTNELAHKLIERFGNIDNVLNAPRDMLVQCNGVSEVVAAYLNFIPAFMDYYLKSKNNEKLKIDGPSEANSILNPLLANLSMENMIVLMIGEKDTYLGYEIIATGTSYCVETTFSEILAVINRFRPKRVILAHNHPRHTSLGSDDDLRFTKNIFVKLRAIGIDLHDHIICAPNCLPYSFNNDNEEYKNFRARCIEEMNDLFSKVSTLGSDSDIAEQKRLGKWVSEN